MVCLFNKFVELGLLVYVKSTVWKDTDGCAKQYTSALDIYLTTVLSSEYGIIIDRSINAPVHGKNVVVVLMLLTNESIRSNN